MSKWENFFKVLKAVGPSIIAMTVPGGPIIAGAIVAAINEAEQIKGASGAEKKAHVVNIAVATAQAVNAGAGKQVVDPAAIESTVGTAVDTTIGTINLIHEAHPDLPDPNAPTP